MNIDDLTIREAKELVRIFGSQPASEVVVCPQRVVWKIGCAYMIRTVTMIDTGLLIAVTDQELVLKHAAWIADTGRFADALISLEFNEVEPFPDEEVIVGRGTVIDAVKISVDKLPRLQK